MKAFFIILFTAIITGLTAQVNQKAPYSDEYEQYLKHPELYTNYRPHPFKMVQSLIETKSTTMLPESYDLRNVDGKVLVSPVKSQGSYGTCWAFAASASLESYWMTLGLPTEHLSVRNFVNCHGFDWTPFEGGNAFLASTYLSRLDGPVYEYIDPYSNMDEVYCIDNKADSIMPAHISRYYKASGMDVIKKLIMKYGAVATSMSTNNFNTHYNSSTFAYYYNSNMPIDHGVTIVGWDDNFVVSGIPSGNPPDKGAWIIKNSWGSWWGDNGYFYVSYYDKYVGKEVSLYPGRMSTNETDTLYMFDKLGAITSHNIAESDNQEVGYALTRFIAPNKQLINRLGSYVNTGGTILDMTVAKGWDGSQLQDTLVYLQNVICRFPGYHSFETSAVVDSGEFYVMIRYETPGYSWPIPVETFENGFSNPRLEPVGKQWISADGIAWEDVGVGAINDFDLCVRAYAKDMDFPIAAMSALKSNYCLGSEVELINNSAGVADSFQWIFRSNSLPLDTVITYSVSDTAKAQINAKGFVDVEMIAYSTEENDTLKRYQLFEMVSEPDLFIINANGSETVARNKSVTIIASGADSYTWQATSDYPESFGDILTFDIQSQQVTIKVRGELGTCFNYDSLTINSVIVPYDDIADAYQLTVNKVAGPFSNAFATVEPNEPAPEEGDCDNQIDWCTEGGLHNSIWFKFIAPITENVRVISYGFDNQLALYDADSWQDIMSGDPNKYTLLAANDDAHSSDYSAEINTVFGLTAGKTYWIQMDGSAGGDEGEATIKVETSVPTFSQFPATVYPVVVVDTVNLELQGLEESGAIIRIYDAAGKIIYFKNVMRHDLNQDISDINEFGKFYINTLDLPSGCYFYKIDGRNVHIINKILIRH